MIEHNSTTHEKWEKDAAINVFHTKKHNVSSETSNMHCYLLWKAKIK